MISDFRTTITFSNSAIYTRPETEHFPKNNWRCTDDLFLVWSDNVEDLKECYEYLNRGKESINFTPNYDSNSISFLDELCKCKTSTMTVFLTWGLVLIYSSYTLR